MNRYLFILISALVYQVSAQIMVDDFDPRVPRPGATLPASLDPYGFSRPLPPSIDPLGISYRPAHAGAVLPALYDPLGASRPGGLPFALDPVGYTRAGPAGYGNGYGRVSNYGGYSAYPGGYSAAYENFLARPSGFLTGVGGSPIFPDPNAAVPLYTGRVHGTPLPPPPAVAMPVVPVQTVPVAPIAPIAPVAPVSYSVNSVPVTAPVNQPPVNPIPIPSFSTNFPNANIPGGNGGNLPLGGNSLPFGTGGMNFPNLANLPNLPNLPTNMPVNSGSLQLSSNNRPLNSGTSVSGGSSSSSVPNSNFLPPV